jgi:hypothetical protein
MESGNRASSEADQAVSPTAGPLVFISHDGRDAELAEAFAKLVKSVSSGMIKTFRSSDTKGAEGIDFGAEWYGRLMAKLQATSDVVCLFTERSIDRPWILFEAGVAKGRSTTPVVGVALGIPLSRVSVGPFYQFQNSDDGADGLSKLLHQLAQRVPGLELDKDVVASQVSTFKQAEEEILGRIAADEGRQNLVPEPEENPVSQVLEEMKALPSRVSEQLMAAGVPGRRRRPRFFNPGMVEDLFERLPGGDDSLPVLIAASLVRDDAPWLYELVMEVYRAIKSGNASAIERETQRLRRVLAKIGHLPELIGGDPDSVFFMMDFTRSLEMLADRAREHRIVTAALSPKSLTTQSPHRGSRARSTQSHEPGD